MLSIIFIDISGASGGENESATSYMTIVVDGGEHGDRVSGK